jgi:hypothetical protein
MLVKLAVWWRVQPRAARVVMFVWLIAIVATLAMILFPVHGYPRKRAPGSGHRTGLNSGALQRQRAHPGTRRSAEWAVVPRE